MKRILSFAAVATLATIFTGLIGATPAFAQDEYDHTAHRHIRRDINDIRRDERRLHELECRRNALRERRDWDGLDRLDFQIEQLRAHIAADRWDVHLDIEEHRRDSERFREERWRHNRDNRRYRDHDDNWHRDHDDHRDNG